MDEAKGDKPTGKSLNEREPVQVPRSQVTVKTAVTLAAVLLGAAAFGWIVAHSTVTIVLTIIAAMLAMVLNRAVDRLVAWRIPRTLAVGLVILGLFAALAGLVLLVAPTAVAQGKDLVDHAPDLWTRIQRTGAWQWGEQHLQIEERVKDAVRAQGGVMTSGARPLAHVVGRVFAGLAGLVTIAFLTVFMLLFGEPLVRAALRETLPVHRERYQRVLGNIYSAIGGYLNGLGVIATLNATLMAIFLLIVRVPFFLPLGILSGLGSFIPLVGATVSGLMIVLVALATKGPVVAIAALIYIVVYQQFENHVVIPVVYKRTVQVNPLVTLLGIVFFAELAGILGAFLAVPLVACLQILLRELLLARRERLGLPTEGDVAAVRRVGRPSLWRRQRHA
ncbi:MAG: AI-2E family transporter [Myxococcaceae bacterium]|nr:AI-2E family transporter [Myxococcaceae bacterium]